MADLHAPPARFSVSSSLSQCPNTGKWIKPEDVLGPSKPGRKVVILGDTSDNRWVAQNAKDADVVVHEATFNNEMRAR